MTTYYEVLQRESDKRWDMTARTNSRAAYPIGYCSGWKEQTREELEERFSPHDPLIESLLRDQEKRRPNKDKYHSDGHATAEEAQHCYATYLLDTGLEFRRHEREAHKCEVCGAWGQSRVSLRADALLPPHWLCDAHANRESYEPIFRTWYERD